MTLEGGNAKVTISTFIWRYSRLSHPPKYQLMAAIGPVLADLDRLEPVAPVKFGDVFDGCVLVRITTDPIDHVVNPAHPTPASRAGQLPDIGSEFPGAHIAEQ